MKVLYLIDSLHGYGAETSLCEIIVVRFTHVTPVMVQIYEGNQLVPFLEEKGVKVYSLNLKKKYNFEKTVRLLRKVIEQEAPQIIHSTLFRADMVGRKLKDIYPEIQLVGSFVSNSYSKRRYYKLSLLSKTKLLSTQWRDRLTAGKVDFFISNSEAIKFSNATALGIPLNKIFTLYRGREIVLKNGSNNIPEDLKRFKPKKVFVNVGRLQPSKGQWELIRAFKKVVSKEPDAILLIAGDGAYENKLKKEIRRSGLEDHVILLGYRSDISQIFELADFFVFPSHFEGLPGALIEAIISQTPTIISMIPENQECIPHEATLCFTPGDIEDMALKMIAAINLKTWKEKTDLAFQYALEHFDIGRVSKNYENFYLELRSHSTSGKHSEGQIL